MECLAGASNRRPFNHRRIIIEMPDELTSVGHARRLYMLLAVVIGEYHANLTELGEQPNLIHPLVPLFIYG